MDRLGIDFGTTTTVASLCTGGVPVVLADDKGNEVMPSVVAFNPNGRVDVGAPAKARRRIDIKNTIYSMKRIVGRKWPTSEVKEFRQRYPFDLEEGRDGEPLFVTRAGKLSARDVAAQLISRFKDFPRLVSTEVSGVVISVPTSFDQPQRQATIAAAERAGFTGAATIEEQHAAALAHLGVDAPKQTVAVYDLGGGTFDLAILEWSGSDARVLAFGGDAYLGGDDIDTRLFEWAAQRILEEHRWDVRTDTASTQSLILACERAKIRLSDAEQTPIPLGQIDTVLKGAEIVVERSELESLFTDLVRRTFIVCDETMRRSGIGARDVDTLVLVGGGAYIPAIRAGVTAYFGKEPRTDLPPDRIVAMGASLQAEQNG